MIQIFSVQFFEHVGRCKLCRIKSSGDFSSPPNDTEMKPAKSILDHQQSIQSAVRERRKISRIHLRASNTYTLGIYGFRIYLSENSLGMHKHIAKLIYSGAFVGRRTILTPTSECDFTRFRNYCFVKMYARRRGIIIISYKVNKIVSFHIIYLHRFQ